MLSMPFVEPSNALASCSGGWHLLSHAAAALQLTFPAPFACTAAAAQLGLHQSRRQRAGQAGEV